MKSIDISSMALSALKAHGVCVVASNDKKIKVGESIAVKSYPHAGFSSTLKMIKVLSKQKSTLDNSYLFVAVATKYEADERDF